MGAWLLFTSLRARGSLIKTAAAGVSYAYESALAWDSISQVGMRRA
jgi:hypothetical protein